MYGNLENYGQFSIGSFFDSFTARYRLSFGKQYLRSISNNSISNIFQLNNYIDIQSLLYDDLVNKLSFDSSLAIKIIPYKKESSYSIYARVPYTFNHYWGELGIMPAIYYSEYFNNSEKDYAIGNNYLFTLLMLDLSKPENNNMLYNFIVNTHIEYKFFMRFLPPLYNSLYIVFYANAGYGKKYNQNFDKGDLLYTAGGGIGFSIFGVPMQVTIGIDQFNDMVIYSQKTMPTILPQLQI